jgi:3-oxoacyl-[acyl-carrier-protein] synthase III
VLNNFGRTMKKLLLMGARVPESKVVQTDVAETGHCYSADPLINLARADAASIFAHRDRILVVANGVSAWSAIALEYVGSV